MGEQTTLSTEQIDVRGSHLVEKIKELVHEGNVRRVIVKDSDGNDVMDVPVSFGVLGLLVAPKIAAVGALAALAADYSIEVERETDAPEPEATRGEESNGEI